MENSNLGHGGGCGVLVDRKKSQQSTVYTVRRSGNTRVLSPSPGTWSGLRQSSPKPLPSCCPRLCLSYCMSSPRFLFSPPLAGRHLYKYRVLTDCATGAPAGRHLSHRKLVFPEWCMCMVSGRQRWHLKQLFCPVV